MAKRSTRRATQPQTTESDTPEGARPQSAPTALMEPEPGPDAIARRAYEIFCERGCEPGRDMDDWLQAERELRDRR